jgi:hypothetical protein
MDVAGFTSKPNEDNNGRPVYGKDGKIIPANGITEEEKQADLEAQKKIELYRLLTTFGNRDE